MVILEITDDVSRSNSSQWKTPTVSLEKIWGFGGTIKHLKKKRNLFVKPMDQICECNLTEAICSEELSPNSTVSSSSMMHFSVFRLSVLVLQPAALLLSTLFGATAATAKKLPWWSR